MKNVGAKFKLWLCLSLVLICALFTATGITTYSSKIFANEQILNPSGALCLTSAEEFSEAISDMTARFPADDGALVFFNKEKDLSLDANGEYFVSEQTFAKLTGVQPEVLVNSSFCSASMPVRSLSDLAAENGYSVTDSDCSMVLTRRFGNRRLIICSDNAELDLHGAILAVHYNDMHVHQYANELETSLAYDFYLSRADVQSVSVDGFCWAESETAETSSLIPIDTESSLTYQTWGADKMGVPEYCQYLRDAAKIENSVAPSLEEVVVAVLDTGIDTDHSWFTNRLLYDENDKIIGKDYTGKASSTEYAFEDDQGHGTHCAGIICDMTLPNVKILPVRFMQLTVDPETGENKATGSMLDAKNGVDYIISKKAQYNIVAINMSFTSENDVFNYASTANNAGIFCVAAAGNDNKNASAYSPANQADAITVSALTLDINSALIKADYSNFGSCVDVCAPGTGIVSAKMGGGLTAMSGTSMAAPHVVAYIALLKSDPLHDYSRTEISQILSGQSVGFIQDLGPTGKDSNFGYGMPVLTAAIPETTYTVNHYIEPIYDLNASEPQFSQYELKESETLPGDYGELTNAVAKNYPGFTVVNFEQETIQLGNTTIVNIYYKRNIYNVSFEQSGNGITEITGAGDYLFGETVELNPVLLDGYEWYLWRINECEDNEFLQNFRTRVMHQTFTMPATNLKFAGYAQQSVFLITVKIVGKGTVTPPDGVTVYYRQGMTFAIKPSEGYQLDSVYSNGVKLEVTELDSENSYSVDLQSITSNTELLVNFVEIAPDVDWVDVMVWGGGAVIAVILFSSSGVMLFIAFHSKKR